ncbi:PadR family transcription regulator [Natronomonas pharaonis DSM 2160]|uniref:PadR family transcription regulator n=1 Tax=Natronomonas pharaonis (strain ATCC 35678 / DSM 2160 / CIP 103997 / JCM 8858 / NBRC 14720 / NCIMB 2260 / Gabara) TaxID=348780 RepID=A0A1U7EXP5_NATPD|nr:helix-turn-helix transcriptional regulator [Natronomonas pharaonis]CAI49979.1 PadR family transcription regulator [Natronomonas pharaonis DSM 2160]
MTEMDPTAQLGSAESDQSITVSQLRAELDGTGQSEAPGTAISEVVDEVEASLFGTDGFSFEETHVKSSLDELLLSLVALRSSDTHGKQLLDDLAQEFDTILSPGTVYPRLHDLCDEDVLEQRELVKTKEYTLDDATEAQSDIAEAARQHLALGMVLRAALEEGDFE